jgi:hypothetical protein
LERNGERRLVEDVIFAEVLDIFEPRRRDFRSNISTVGEYKETRPSVE